MATLADFTNAPTEVEFEGTVYHLRLPDQIEEGMFQRWLEQKALHGIERAEFEDEGNRQQQMKLHFESVGAGIYEAGGLLYAKALTQLPGVAKMISIINRDRALRHKDAERLVQLNMKEVCVSLISRIHTDPKVLEAVLARFGLPSDYLSRNSATRPSEAPGTSTPSSDSATTSYSVSSMSSDTPMAPPS